MALTILCVTFLVFLIATVLHGGWVTGQWFVVDLDRSKLHPGYFLPTVAGGRMLIVYLLFSLPSATIQLASFLTPHSLRSTDSRTPVHSLQLVRPWTS